ncbi:hypothetical protein MW887_007569 [Aspergillus wentii]|nr:hypothetical protein MW887_007569 [Aspergillus wentii]
MGHPPASILNYYQENPNGTPIAYLAKIMADRSKVTFTDSLCEQDRTIVPIDQIESAIDSTFGKYLGSKIVRLSDSTILKLGWRVTMGEAEALILIAAKTNVPVPKVISAYTVGDIGFILMSKIDGKTLASCMKTMSSEEMQVIVRQLKSYVQEWRQLGSSFLGSVNGGPCRDILFRHPWDYKSTKTYGPFYSFKQYKLGVVEALRLSRPEGIWYDEEEILKEKILSFGDERLPNLGVMTHGDLHAGNIIVKDGLIAGIVDWGEAGYSLAEREFFAARRIATGKE